MTGVDRSLSLEIDLGRLYERLTATRPEAVAIVKARRLNLIEVRLGVTRTCWMFDCPAGDLSADEKRHFDLQVDSPLVCLITDAGIERLLPAKGDAEFDIRAWLFSAKPGAKLFIRDEPVIFRGQTGYQVTVADAHGTEKQFDIDELVAYRLVRV